MDLSELRGYFPKDAIKWKAQTANEAGTQALAVPYIDARAAAWKLDKVVGPENWKDLYTVVEFKGKEYMECTLSIRVGDEWISKHGYGDANDGKSVESDSFKRAAVKCG